MGLSLKQFRERVFESGLVSHDDVGALLADLPDERRPQDGEQLARLLVQQKRLTAFQAQQIYAGKGKSLTLGNYLVLEKLGQGGMGLVLKAEHRRMERLVALKVLSPAISRNRDAVRRFQREVKAAAKLDHPNIVTAYDADEAGGTHFLVMQYVDGTDLASLVREKGPLTIAEAVDYILQVARGLDYAHSRGVVHRDIKPSNLLLDRTGTVKILDMGLARLESAGAEQDQLTGTGQIMGTVDYMAPEQAVDTKSADARADVYSLGATLWFLLTARAMYEGDTLVKKLMAQQKNPLPSLREARPGVSGELDTVFARMVAKSPEVRYQSMSEVVAELKRCTSGPVAAPPIAPPPSEYARLNELLPDVVSSPQQAVVLQGVARRRATNQAEHPGTVRLGAADADTDPKTEQSLAGRPGAFPSIAGSLEKAAQRVSALLPRSTPARVALLGGAGGAVLVALAALVAIAATVVFFVRTKDGVIRVEINDPSIEVALQGTEIVLKQADNGTDVKLSPGEKTLLVQRGDFQFETDTLVLRKGETVTVHVELLASEIQVRHGGQIIGQAALPADDDGPARTAGVDDTQTSGRFALVFDSPDDYVEVPTLEYDGGPLTLEARVELTGKKASEGTILGISGDWHASLWLASQGVWIEEQRLGLTVLRGDGARNQEMIEPVEFASSGRIHHLAGVFDGRATWLFLDGKQVGRREGVRGDTTTSAGFSLGRPGASIIGGFYEVRVSDFARYTEDFTPAESLDSDEHTLALYRCDEGQGDVLGDSSGNGHDGKIHGATWLGGDEIFDGVTLQGWEGDERFWSVRDGAITGETTAARSPSGNTYLIWRGGDVGDFELRLKYRLVGGNSGIQYRSKDLGNFVVAGYQLDIDSGDIFTGALYEERGRGMLAECGTEVLIQSNGSKTVVGKTAARELLVVRKLTNGEDWNECTIIARGNHLVHIINGHIAADVTDNETSKRAASGVLALQLHAGPPMLVQFKDIRLRKLE